MLLKTLAIVVGVAAAVTRLVGVAAPEVARAVLKLLLDRRKLMLFLMVVAAVLGSLFIWAFRLYAATAQPVSGAAWALLVFGVFMTSVGLFFLWVPAKLVDLLSKFYVARSGTLRLISAAGVVLGIVLILLGLCLQTG